ncbi:hypothetical protein [Gluconobacter kanchanaburiensis]|uniref:NADH:quinone oxidoreductase/Mrp antiporter membrane subunit domain-containing protein n=1 Tax=Gluconobacter kanchanaburiensis NBRC 103587 TaxID=1307948 RepID=A0A511B5U0_9PROT|nr:hypothetical protein [Gluconobacter kanchanaburiensis]GBR68322.1 hypothetical protein AA103587_0746 [Gluconobacter kanchanaburiensis NBRC 103587]GEK95815.1 hypothetical protein GKA01_10120 [Gluconobacter kanchanaburiensis NBRC 103587]
MSLCLAALSIPVSLQNAEGGRSRRSAIASTVILLAGLVAILTLSPAVLAIAIGVLATQDRDACPAVWSVPTLLLSVLFPGQTPVLLALMPVLFWSALVRRGGKGSPGFMSLLGASLVWHAPGAIALELITGLEIGVLVLVGWSIFGARRPGDLGLLRPVLLMGLVTAAQAEGLADCARIALEALFLDLALRGVCSVLADRFPVLLMACLPLPLMPGLAVLWLGIHAALGLSAGVEGWSVPGVAVALLLAVLGLSDILVFGEMFRTRQGRVTGPSVLLLGATGLLFPALVLGIVSPVLHAIGGTWVWPVWYLGGGDGAHLPVMAIVLLGAAIWIGLVRPWRISGGIIHLASTLVPALVTFLSIGDGLFGEPPALGWKMRRGIVAGRRRLGMLRKMEAPVLPDLHQGAIGLWLVLLGLVLAVLGVMA